MLLAISWTRCVGQLDLQACALDRWATRRIVSSSCSWQQTARSSSSFVQYIVFSSEKSPASLRLCNPWKESKLRTRHSKATGSNIRGVTPFPRSSTQAALLACSARGENHAHEFTFKAPGLFVGGRRHCFSCLLVHSGALAPRQSRIPSLSVLSGL